MKLRAVFLYPTGKTQPHEIEKLKLYVSQFELAKKDLEGFLTFANETLGTRR